MFARFKPRHDHDYSGTGGDSKGHDHIRWLLFVLFYTIIANVPFWIAARWFGLLPLGWFCIEYAGIGLLALFVSPILAAALLLPAIAGDLLSAVSKTYYLAPTDCLINLGSLQDLPNSRLLAIFALATITVLILAIALLIPVSKIQAVYRSYAALSLVAFAFLAVSADSASVVHETGHISSLFGSVRPGDALKFSNYGNLWVSRYPLVRLVRNEELFRTSRSIVGASLGDSVSIAGASAIALHSSSLDSGGGPQGMPNLVLVLVESWGLDLDQFVRDALVRSYTHPELEAQYVVSQGTVPFYGSTVGGESRELCESEIGFQIANVSAQALQHCLPDRLASLGYRTIALHGMSGHMFNRQTWYRSIGFQEQWFRDRFRQQGLPDCVGAFVGTCDAAVSGWMGQLLETHEASPEFVYWVTLNSHLPLPVPSGLPNAESCSLTHSLSSQSTLCSWYQLVANVHTSIARLAMGTLGRPTVFVVVGDHAPPFANPDLRGQFSSAEVPYVLLVPRHVNRIPQQDNRAGNYR